MFGHSNSTGTEDKPMTAEEMKKAAAMAAIEWVEDDSIIGVGTGSTANHFIDALGRMNTQDSADANAGRQVHIRGAVASSEATAERLRSIGVELCDLNTTGTLSLYVDGTDEANQQLQLIKGGGGALTREKIVAAASTRFVCIADASKKVDVLGEFPLPIEVIPMARSYVAREVVKLGGDPELRDQFTTDNGNVILDIHNMKITDPVALEQQLNQLPGVVTCGLFAMRSADVLLIGNSDGGVEKITK